MDPAGHRRGFLRFFVFERRARRLLGARFGRFAPGALRAFAVGALGVLARALRVMGALALPAARRFARYAKAKRAAQEINERLAVLQTELNALAAQRAELERAINTHDADALEAIAAQFERRAGRRGAQTQAGQQKQGRTKVDRKATEQAKVARVYRSSDGYEILVGRGARANDQLTFRLARPHDLWLHAADYPGSHVVVRNPRRTEIPQRTVIEAAQLAAYYSQAKQDAKVAVHYTQRKFVAKPKGAAPGLVRIASFRSMLVVPRESGERI